MLNPPTVDDPGPLLTPAWSAQRAHPKLDPRLSALVELDDAAYGQDASAPLPVDTGHEAAAPNLRRSGPLAFFRGTLDRGSWLEATVSASIPVFITAASEEALSHLAKIGVLLRSRAGTLATAEIPLAVIELLEERDDVVSIEWTGGAKPQAAEAKPAGQASARRAMRLPIQPDPAADGRGTYVGIVDLEGLDIYHPDFVGEDGTSRVAFLWDQKAPRRAPPGAGGLAPEPWRYGLEYTRLDLALELDPNRRERQVWVRHQALKGSHGTMVAGLAAGRGALLEDARGIAPGAEILFVNTCASGAGALAAMTELAEAIDYVFQRAGDTPVAVNISLGDDLGPRDGTSPVERFIDALLAVPGRAVIVAAGNSRTQGKHVAGVAAAGAPSEVSFKVAPGLSDNAVIEIWYEAGTARLELELCAPRGAGRTPWYPGDGLPCAFDVAGTHVIVAGAAPYPGSKNGLIRIELFPGRAGGVILDGAWRVCLRAGGDAACAWHAWIDHRAIRWGSTGDADLALTITSPGSCKTAITVGAADTTGADACWFSGQGPGRGGVEKPDLLARGVDLVVACASTTRQYVEHVAGTSFAAPQVTGAAALLFQRLGRVPASEIKRRLTATAAEAPAGGHDSRRGSGRAQMGDLPAAPETDNRARRPAASALKTGRQDMNDGTMTGNQHTPARPDLSRPADAVQLGVGLYNIIQADVVVGTVLVVDLGSGHTAEHWGLYPSYRWPSSLNPRQTTMHDYQGAAVDPARFKDSLPRGTTYVVADCVQSTLP
jgi:subtilisin family serine protease